jgi:hypothetical protein
MFCARSLTKPATFSTILPIPVSLTSGDDRGIWLYPYSRMTTVAESPARAEVNREGTLMVTAVNGTIGPQPFPRLDSIDQVAERNEVNHFSPLGHL